MGWRATILQVSKDDGSYPCPTRHHTQKVRPRQAPRHSVLGQNGAVIPVLTGRGVCANLRHHVQAKVARRYLRRFDLLDFAEPTASMQVAERQAVLCRQGAPNRDTSFFVLFHVLHECISAHFSSRGMLLRLVCADGSAQNIDRCFTEFHLLLPIIMFVWSDEISSVSSIKSRSLECSDQSLSDSLSVYMISIDLSSSGLSSGSLSESESSLG
jgi:membrane glycosyltransferase